MIVYTADGLRRLSLMFDLYDTGQELSAGELLFARDYAAVSADRWADLAQVIASRLDVEPVWYRVATVAQVERCKKAYHLWRAGLAEPAHMMDAMNYCTYQADAWDDETAIMDALIRTGAEEVKNEGNNILRAV